MTNSIIADGVYTRLNADMTFESDVAFNGAAGPGRVYEVTGYRGVIEVRVSYDARSRSRRSGHLEFALKRDRLYILSGIVVGKNASGTEYLSTFGEPAYVSEKFIEAERARMYPGEKLECDERDRRLAAEAEIARLNRAAREKRFADEAEARLKQRLIEKEALAEINAEAAARIEAEGQPDNGMPEIEGTPKQVAYALSIRDAFAKREPDSKLLRTKVKAKFWIENHRSVLYAR